jgi:hypothetical protein
LGTEAEKPAKPKPGGPKEGQAMLLADAIVCGAHYYAESAASNAGLPPELKAFRSA